MLVWVAPTNLATTSGNCLGNSWVTPKGRIWPLGGTDRGGRSQGFHHSLVLVLLGDSFIGVVPIGCGERFVAKRLADCLWSGGGHEREVRVGTAQPVGWNLGDAGHSANSPNGPMEPSSLSADQRIGRQLVLGQALQVRTEPFRNLQGSDPGSGLCLVDPDDGSTSVEIADLESGDFRRSHAEDQRYCRGYSGRLPLQVIARGELKTSRQELPALVERELGLAVFSSAFAVNIGEEQCICPSVRLGTGGEGLRFGQGVEPAIY